MKEEFKWRKHVCKRNVKGSPKTQHWSNDYPEFWPRREGWQSKQKQCDLRNRSQERHSRCSPTVLEMVRYTAESRTVVNKKRAVDRAVTDHGDLAVKLTADTLRLQMNHVRTKKGILVQKKSSVIGGRRIFLTKMHTTDGKGICRSSWRKWMRYPRRLRIPSLNKIAQTAVRPSPLWEFRAANCFRDSIVA